MRTQFRPWWWNDRSKVAHCQCLLAKFPTNTDLCKTRVLLLDYWAHATPQCTWTWKLCPYSCKAPQTCLSIHLNWRQCTSTVDSLWFWRVFLFSQWVRVLSSCNYSCTVRAPRIALACLRAPTSGTWGATHNTSLPVQMCFANECSFRVSFCLRSWKDRIDDQRQSYGLTRRSFLGIWIDWRKTLRQN